MPGKPQPTTYIGFSDEFLKFLIETGEKSNNNGDEIDMNVEFIDVTGKNYYEILGMDKPLIQEILGKGNNDKTGRTIEVQVEDGLQYPGGPKKYKIIKKTKVLETIRHFHSQAAKKKHTDKGGKEGQAWISLLMEALNVLKNEQLRKKYEEYYQEMQDYKPSPAYRQKVKKRLQELKLKTDPTLGGNLGREGEDKEGRSEKEGRDVSKYKHLFPSQSFFIDKKIGAPSSKAGVSRCANWINGVYGLLIALEVELKGEDSAFFNQSKNWTTKKKRVIKEAELGAYANFKNDIWNYQHFNDVNNYYEQVKSKIKSIIYGGKAPEGNYSWEKAQNENLQTLLFLDGWDELSGPENKRYTEKFHFYEGYRGFSGANLGIKLMEFDDPNNPHYQRVIKECQNFIAIKKLVKNKLAELETLWNAEGGKVGPSTFSPISRKLKELGELEQKGHESTRKNKDNDNTTSSGSYSGNFSVDFTKMKFKNVSDSNLLIKIGEAFKELRKQITEKGESKPRDNSNKNPGGGRGGSGNPKDEAIREIRKAFVETGVSAEDLGWDRISDKIQTGWEKCFSVGSWGFPQNVEKMKQGCLNGIYRFAARKKITQTLSENSLSIDILGIGNDKDILMKHFKVLRGKSQINAERNRLLSLINNQEQNQDQEIIQAIAAVKNVLRDNGLEEDQEKIKVILGENWENQFQGQRSKTEIEGLKNKFIQLIKDFAAQNKSNVSDIIKEIEEALREASLSEKILGENWKTKFEGKSETEINAERERLLKLIEDEINKKESKGEISQGDAQKRRETILKNRKEQSKKDIDKKLKEGHQKLTVKPDELPTSLFAPYKTLEEKLKSLKNLEEISDFNNKIAKEIEKKKGKKLENIQDETIKKIKKEIESSSKKIELGKNKDYEKKIKEAKDPDVIELLEKNILALIKEQKGESKKESIDNPTTNSPDKFSLAKVLGITALIVLPLIAVVLIILQMRRRKLNRERYN